MKKFILFPLFGVTMSCFAQNVKMGYAGRNGESELLQTDPVMGKQQHYRVFPFSMKAGQGAVFIITSSVFKPHIILSTASGQLIASGMITKADGSEVKASFIAPADTSFAIVFASAEENKTGQFNYEIKILESSQIIFNEEYSFCDRLAYLLNHWQLSWLLVQGSLQHGFQLQPGAVVNTPYDYYASKYTLVKGKKAEITDKYRENIFSLPYLSKEEEQKELAKFYNKLSADIRSCVDANAWTIETEGFDLKIFSSPSSFIPTTTHFIFKGAVKDQELKSFKLVLKPPLTNLLEKEENRTYDVQLIFN